MDGALIVGLELLPYYSVAFSAIFAEFADRREAGHKI